MANELKFFKGNKINLPVSRENDSFYIAIDAGEIHLADKIWHAGSSGGSGNGFIDASVSTAGNSIIITFTDENSATKSITLLTGVNGICTTTTIDNDGDIKTNVVISDDIANGDNILYVNGSDGLHATIRPVYTDGVLQLQFWNGSIWKNVGDSVTLHIDNFLAYATFVKTQGEYDIWKPTHGDVNVTISEPSIVLIMRSEQGSVITYTPIVVPKDDLYSIYTFTDTDNIGFTTTTTGNTNEITANVKFGAIQDSVVNLSGVNGLKADFKLSTIQGDVILKKESDGLKADVKIDANGGLMSNSNGVATKISSTVNNGLIIEPDGLFVSKSPISSISDTNSVNLITTSGALTAHAKVNATNGIEVTNTGLGIKINNLVGGVIKEDGILLSSTVDGLAADLYWGTF